jgi:hypothetical protein
MLVDHPDWNAEASRTLKALLVRHGLSYADLVNELNARGGDESYASIANKISRGTFTFAFYLRCVSVLETFTSDAFMTSSPVVQRGDGGVDK